MQEFMKVEFCAPRATRAMNVALLIAVVMGREITPSMLCTFFSFTLMMAATRKMAEACDNTNLG